MDDFEISDETEVLAMLKFYHNLGHIIYFGGDDDKKSQVLKDFVILDPQWLIDAFKQVITITPPRHQVSPSSCLVGQALCHTMFSIYCLKYYTKYHILYGQSKLG